MKNKKFWVSLLAGIMAVIMLLGLVLGTGGALFYFLYLKKKPF